MPGVHFEVKDVNGNRISLSPIGKKWHASCVLPESSAALTFPTWGYVTREYDAPPGYMRNWTYGRGDAEVYLIYNEK